jgi:hypothetical protein
MFNAWLVSHPVIATVVVSLVFYLVAGSAGRFLFPAGEQSPWTGTSVLLATVGCALVTATVLRIARRRP